MRDTFRCVVFAGALIAACGSSSGGAPSGAGGASAGAAGSGGASAGSGGASAGSGGASAGSGGASAGGGSAAGASSCAEAACAGPAVCASLATRSSSLIFPEAGACPAGEHDENGLCKIDYRYVCVTPSGCTGAVNCMCGVRACPTDYAVCVQTPSKYYDPASQLYCSQSL